MIEISLPWPPTVNHYWRHAQGRHYIAKQGLAYRTTVLAEVMALLGIVKPLAGRLRVHIACIPPDKRVRDLDNLTKSLLDSLTHANVWEDDSQIDDLHLVRHESEKPGWVIVTIGEI